MTKIDEIILKNSLEFQDQKKLMRTLLKMSANLYGESEELALQNEDYWMEMDKHSFRYIAITKNKKIVGLVDFIPINNKGIDKLKTGKLKENNFLKFIDKSNANKKSFYCLSIALYPKFRKKGIAQKLIITNCKAIEEKNILIKEIYATLWSEEGKQFFAQYNPIYLTTDEKQREIIKFQAP
jgi:GNAT superfamily N-acetyltransferase